MLTLISDLHFLRRDTYFHFVVFHFLLPSNSCCCDTEASRLGFIKSSSCSRGFPGLWCVCRGPLPVLAEVVEGRRLVAGLVGVLDGHGQGGPREHLLVLGQVAAEGLALGDCLQGH